MLSSTYSASLDFDTSYTERTHLLVYPSNAAKIDVGISFVVNPALLMSPMIINTVSIGFTECLDDDSITGDIVPEFSFPSIVLIGSVGVVAIGVVTRKKKGN